jgi:hypothetical protein
MPNDRDRTTQGQARAGNRLATKHGIYSSLAVGSLPKGCSFIRRQLNAFRVLIEDRVREATGGKEQEGPDGLLRAALIASAVEHERIRRLANWYMAERGDTMPSDQAERFMGMAARATAERDRVLREVLGNAASLPPTGEDGQPGLSYATFQKLRQSMGFDATPGEPLAGK